MAETITTLQYSRARVKELALQYGSVAMTERDFDDWASEFMVCTEFAAAYKRANPDAVIKFGSVDGNDHCWVYDPALDRTLDATLSQFLSLPFEDDWFSGEEHPHAEQHEEFHTIEAFAQGPGGTALLEG